MAVIEKLEAVALLDIVKGGKELLARLEPNEREYIQTLLEARISFKEGDRTAWEQFVKDNNTRVMAGRLRQTREGRAVMDLIYQAVPIGIIRLVKSSALAVHGEVTIGEVNNPEGILEEIEI